MLGCSSDTLRAPGEAISVKEAESLYKWRCDNERAPHCELHSARFHDAMKELQKARNECLLTYFPMVFGETPPWPASEPEKYAIELARVEFIYRLREALLSGYGWVWLYDGYTMY